MYRIIEVLSGETKTRYLHSDEVLSLVSMPLSRRLQAEDGWCPSCEFLKFYGFSEKVLKRAVERATINGTDGAGELIAAGDITEEAYYRTLATHLNVRFCEAGEISHPMVDKVQSRTALIRANSIWARLEDNRTVLLVSPPTSNIQAFRNFVRANMERNDVVITTPTVTRALLVNHLREEMVQRASSGLLVSRPLASARTGANFWQGICTSVLLVALTLAFTLSPGVTALVLQIAFSSFFIGCALLRFAAMRGFERPHLRPLDEVVPAELPRYSVLVTLLHEANIVPDLINSLSRLNWPHSKIEIMLVCEEHDRETIEAIEKQNPDRRFQIVIVPPGGPKTKPKALNYALQLVNGAFVTVYDAEDRPHPDQLIEAYQTFNRHCSSVACLQAPLIAANYDETTISGLFHLEYAGLFRGLLPWLLRQNTLILLGGTSNHFRIEALREVGAWDPHNVTEDADLGIRLWREGYRTEMISRPTLEDAPVRLRDWLPQRTRWFKGWYQTLAVHTRRPGNMMRRLSLRAYVIINILLFATVISALVHPFFLVSAIWQLFVLLVEAEMSLARLALAWVEWSTILLSYFAFMALCWRATTPKQRPALRKALYLVPLYWVLQSYAAWRAIYQLVVRPFHWEKTPHTPHRKKIQTLVQKAI